MSGGLQNPDTMSFVGSTRPAAESSVACNQGHDIVVSTKSALANVTSQCDLPSKTARFILKNGYVKKQSY